ncbi:hypothetical protein GCM10027184_25140 [Saccharothrix stipae]
MTTSWVEKSGLLDTVAGGVLALSFRDNPSSSVPPYPDETQQALDHVVLRCLHKQITPPTGVPQLIRWCTDLTRREWSALGMGGPPLAIPRLVDPIHRTRTRTCAELAGLSQVADELMATISADAAPSEVVERRWFVGSQILVDPRGHRELLMSNPRTAVIFKSVKDLYGPVPEEWVVRDMIALCPQCGLPALPGSSDDRFTMWCESEICPPNLRIERRYPAMSTLVLHPALRLFVSLSAKTEERIYGDFVLAKLGLRRLIRAGRCQGVVSYRGAELVLQVYDRAEPALLAYDAVADQVDLAVVSSGLLTVRPDFHRALMDALPNGARVNLVTDDSLVAYLTDDQKGR